MKIIFLSPIQELWSNLLKMGFTRVVIACDHAAVAARAKVAEILTAAGTEVVDCGTKTADRVDYPDKAAEVCKLVAGDENTAGVLLCGSGIGMSIAASKVAGIRAALCHDHYTAAMCRKHNNANILCMGARTSGPDVIAEMLQTFLATDFEGGRHAGRVEKLMSPKPVLTFSPEASKTVVLGCDHAAFEEKNLVLEFVKSLGHDVVDCGVNSPDRVDYPDLATAVCSEVAKTGGKGILVCYTVHERALYFKSTVIGMLRNNAGVFFQDDYTREVIL